MSETSERNTILVTGGAGFVGSHFARMAFEAGRNVVILDNLSGGEPAALPEAIPLIVGELGDAPLVRRLCKEHRVGAVAHFAGKIQVGESVVKPELYFQVNVVDTLALLAALRDEGVQACLFSSSAAVYGAPRRIPIPESARCEPINAYGATKLCVEFALDAWGRAHGLCWAALRYFNAAGAHPDGTLRENHEPETHLIPIVVDAGLGLRGPVSVFGDDYDTPDGTCVRDYVHVQDLASAHLLALDRLERGETLGAINLGTGRGFSVRAVIDAAAAVMGVRIPHEVGPRRAGDPAVLVADPTFAQELLGWQPVRSDLWTIVEDTLRSRRPARRMQSKTA